MSVFKQIDWNSLRRKAWHTGLVLGAAYASTDPRFAWAIPALTAAAGQSSPPLDSLPRAFPGIAMAAVAGTFAVLVWRA